MFEGLWRGICNKQNFLINIKGCYPSEVTVWVFGIAETWKDITIECNEIYGKLIFFLDLIDGVGKAKNM